VAEFDPWENQRRQAGNPPPLGPFSRSLDAIRSVEAEDKALAFRDWFNTWLSFGSSQEALRQYLPPHLLGFWEQTERAFEKWDRERQERAERGDGQP
jgi:hypothetical protein